MASDRFAVTCARNGPRRHLEDKFVDCDGRRVCCHLFVVLRRSLGNVAAEHRWHVTFGATGLAFLGCRITPGFRRGHGSAIRTTLFGSAHTRCPLTRAFRGRLGMVSLGVLLGSAFNLKTAGKLRPKPAARHRQLSGGLTKRRA
jgi:hypothetical protein